MLARAVPQQLTNRYSYLLAITVVFSRSNSVSVAVHFVRHVQLTTIDPLNKLRTHVVIDAWHTGPITAAVAMLRARWYCTDDKQPRPSRRVLRQWQQRLWRRTRCSGHDIFAMRSLFQCGTVVTVSRGGQRAGFLRISRRSAVGKERIDPYALSGPCFGFSGTILCVQCCYHRIAALTSHDTYCV
jgi:hypothetical protein